MDTSKEAQNIFESISCLCAEGVEFMSSKDVIEKIGKLSINGYDLCKRHQQGSRVDRATDGELCMFCEDPKCKNAECEDDY